MTEKINKILVPLDGSRMAESTLPVAQLLATCLGARITLLHVLEERPPQKVHGESHLTTAQEASDYLDSLSGRLGGGMEPETHVHSTEESNVAASVADHAGELGAGIVALCTHGRSDLRRVVMGSIAQQVLRRVKVPVLLVRPGVEPPSHFGTIITPLDEKGEGEVALPLAAGIARSCQAILHLVTVVPSLSTVSGDEAATARLTPIATAAALEAEEEQARQYLVSQVERLVAEGVRARGEVKRGERVQMIAETAARTRADLVVMGTHGRAGLDAFWIGSVAASLINKITQPLLLVRIAE